MGREEGVHGAVQPTGAVPKPLMWITPGRVFYAGLLGRPSVRRIGGTIVYVAQQVPIRVSIDGAAWVEGELLVVPPYVPHRVACEARTITDLIVEPETVDRASLPSFMRDRQGAVEAPEFVSRVRQSQRRLQGCGSPLPLEDAAFDETFFGGALPQAALDARIAKVLADIARDPGGMTSAEDYADRVHLSLSRFVHLFKDEAGTSLRSLRSWKRARSMLGYVTHSVNLADIAQHTGYPDSSHFSHSIRQVFGLAPKDVFAGSRRMELHGQPAGEVVAARRGGRERGG
jgi:AraC-like DNA-binding protein